MSLPYLEASEKAAKKTPEKTDDLAASMQSSMVYTFPLMTILIGVSFASSLAIYWLAFSAYQVVQQYQSTGWGGATSWIKKLQGLLA
jgi:membrane protein insertase Oxa1/YidC/SpoIIIJ